VKTSLDHLPDAKRRELARIVEILFAEFEDALKGRNAPHRKAGRILKIILFGSYARGDWVDDPKGGYKSDYDLLVVVNHEELADLAEYWGKADDHLLRAYQIAHELTAPANFIVHDLTDVNKQLKRGRPFFVDIVRDGIALYEAPDHPLEHAEPLSPQAALKEAQGYFDQWFKSAEGFTRNAGYAGPVAETTAINPALAISGIELINQWYYRPDYHAIMSDCSNVDIGVWSANLIDRSVVVAVYGKGDGAPPVQSPRRPFGQPGAGAPG